MIPLEKCWSRAWKALEAGCPEEVAGFAARDRIRSDPALTRKEFRLPPGFAPYDSRERDRVSRHNRIVLEAFRDALPGRASVYVLDEHHTCYRFDPFQPLEHEATADEIWGMKTGVPAVSYHPLWLCPVIPEGDDIQFVSPEAGLLYGYSWVPDGQDQRILVIGAALLAFFQYMPSPLLLDIPPDGAREDRS